MMLLLSPVIAILKKEQGRFHAFKNDLTITGTPSPHETPEVIMAPIQVPRLPESVKTSFNLTHEHRIVAVILSAVFGQ